MGAAYMLPLDTKPYLVDQSHAPRALKVYHNEGDPILGRISSGKLAIKVS
jgi:hypothetical protein